MLRLCIKCGADIAHKRTNAKYCNHACRVKAKFWRYKKRNPDKFREYARAWNAAYRLKLKERDPLHA